MSWGYEKENGPDTWVDTYLNGKAVRQSPVDIEPKKAKRDSSLSPLVINYEEELDLVVSNTGLSFKMDIGGNSIMSGGPLGDTKYKLVQFHFHWGSKDDEGSEHRVDGKMYASELHLVHYNSDKYASFQDAVTQPDGLAVLGVFLKVGNEHSGFKVLSESCSKIKCKDSKVHTGVKFNPKCLLPENACDYWTYEGSLTTPPLCESVTWIVLRKEIEISKEQIDAMRSLSSETDGSKRQLPNYRPPQSLKDREIKASFPIS